MTRYMVVQVMLKSAKLEMDTMMDQAQHMKGPEMVRLPLAMEMICVCVEEVTVLIAQPLHLKS